MRGRHSSLNHAARFALVGDVLFQGLIGRTDFPYGDHAALIGCRWMTNIPRSHDNPELLWIDDPEV
jgi:hypothetical protein